MPRAAVTAPLGSCPFGQQYVAYVYLFWHACNNKVQDIITSSRLMVYLREKVVMQQFRKLHFVRACSLTWRIPNNFWQIEVSINYDVIIAR